MKFLVLGCKTLREGVVVAVTFFVAGLLTTLAGQHVVPALLHMNHMVLLLGFVMLLLAPLVLISTFLLSVWPGAHQKTEKCDH
ncbi:MAG: hypothetical protein R3E46_17465 [Sedimenticolaceae bacterium]|nr:hypothetical protein [Chromatiaceae bacterium]MCP5439568.1 hypothetical protein [Chromatiaceae bacterium]HPE81477.1 hypothetical protein [Gammaproteobacteria bacterium]